MALPDLLNIAAAYGLDPDIAIQSVARQGMTGRSYVVRAPDRTYFLKRYRNAAPRRIREVHATISFMGRAGIPVVPPYLTVDGHTFVGQDESYFALFPLVNGKVQAKDSLDEGAIKSLARQLGSIHRASRQGRLPSIHQYQGWNERAFTRTSRNILSCIHSKSSSSSIDQLVLESLKRKMLLVESGPPAYKRLGSRPDCLIHGDYHEENILFDTENAVAYVLDWERCEIAPREYEVAYALWSICFDGRSEPEGVELAALFLETYQKTLSLPHERLDKGWQLLLWREVFSLWNEANYDNVDYSRAKDPLPGKIDLLSRFAERRPPFTTI